MIITVEELSVMKAAVVMLMILGMGAKAAPTDRGKGSVEKPGAAALVMQLEISAATDQGFSDHLIMYCKLCCPRR